MVVLCPKVLGDTGEVVYFVISPEVGSSLKKVLVPMVSNPQAIIEVKG